MTEFELKPIGYIRNNIDNRSDMTAFGVKSTIEILPEYTEAAESLEENSHLIVCCLFHKGKRDVLKVHPRKFNLYSISERGVFATRSPDRPNPISISVVKLLSRKNHCIFEVEGMDLVNGTPILDIKPYTDMDFVFNFSKYSGKGSFAQTTDEMLYTYIKNNCLKFISAHDDSLDDGIFSLIKMIKLLDLMPDRSVVKNIETDLEGNALDCWYLFTKLTPGENRMRQISRREINSYVKVYFKNETSAEVKKTANGWIACMKNLSK